MSTGGPAGIYADSVYPECHTGTSSLALLAGAKAQNLTEWQYGLASVNPRWNVSGTYMQVLPRFVSIDENGKLCDGLEEMFRFTEEMGDTRAKVQETFISGNKFKCLWRDVRPIPQNDNFFENVLRGYRENKNIY